MVQQPEGAHGNGTNGELQNNEGPADSGEMVNLLIEGLETGGVTEAETTTAVEVENTDITMETTQGGDGDKEPNPEGETSVTEKSVAAQAPSSNGGSPLSFAQIVMGSPPVGGNSAAGGHELVEGHQRLGAIDFRQLREIQGKKTGSLLLTKERKFGWTLLWFPFNQRKEVKVEGEEVSDENPYLEHERV
ncbi:unnamed protein product [Linum trigynum]|uniref:Uncharacterized protein n=1 Tax=Linum trigynum TaxID=586398 RepID=A0AAV2EWE5_9ROSI